MILRRCHAAREADREGRRSAIEELVKGDGFLAARTAPAGPDSAHEAAAVLAELGADEADFALGALVNGPRFLRPGGGELGRCLLELVATAPGGLTAGV